MRLLLVDDQALFLSGLRHMVTAHGFEVVGTAADGLEALVKARALRPDAILMDIDMPGCNGLEASRRIKAELPDVKIVMLTVSAADEDLFEAVRSGASGYLLKSLEDDQFCELLSRLVEGDSPFSPGLAARILADYARLSAETTQANSTQEDGSLPDTPPKGGGAQLTPRQMEILALVAQGMTYREIGAALYLSESTVKYHMSEMLERLHLRHRSEAIAYAERIGLTSQRDDGRFHGPTED